jgi:transcriptional regulator with XRE-family HTH domain
LTQEELAARTPYSAKHLQEIELGEANCAIGALTDIAVALNRPLHEIFEPLRPEEVPHEPYAGRTQSRTIAFLAVTDSKIPPPVPGRPPVRRRDSMDEAQGPSKKAASRASQRKKGQ